MSSSSSDAPPPPEAAENTPFEPAPLAGPGTERTAPPAPRELDAVYEIPVQVSAVLGRATMQVSQLLKLGRGAVVELDRKLGEAVDIYVNNRLVARGEVVMVDDNRLGVTMTEIVKADRGL
jgi:flagellar motor switch protein FliN/FliY